ncbi:NAD(P)-binding domain-containing protein [Planktotalea arctica]|uniref:NAD(P)-binding domain-containing protein n=1 Tax=Planktotalea arctica TaxID=1481893 RepID=UPI001593985E|nr:NAD(P)-binding domain-containing protein [Planktotalea arctica]
MSCIGFLGAGHIAAPMMRFLAGKGHDVLVSKCGAVVASELAASVGAKVMGNQQVVDRAEIVFLCLRPAVWQEVVSGLNFSRGPAGNFGHGERPLRIAVNCNRACT